MCLQAIIPVYYPRVLIRPCWQAQRCGLNSHFPNRQNISHHHLSLITVVQIQDEFDVLHIKKLPLFESLTPRYTELLLQYLTVPYLRIPLVLSLFADPVCRTSYRFSHPPNDVRLCSLRSDC